ncbi:NAD(P)/FAD-dependent oxidoreductase [Ensifer aridi]|uniref:NAD(P)/FAD-dependent oxidoreductase n=1 Tax=Ensifer aridi TaxID=1708715 RepID=UPI00040A34AB|nr:FAD-binding oxidoreductase [Ensifer aridi]
MANNSRVVVVGAGIIGLSAAYHALAEGFDVTIIDREPAGDKASFGNAGGIAVTEVIPASVPGLWRKAPFWMLDPLGPLSVRFAHAPRLLPWLWHFSQVGSASEVDRISKALAAINGRTYEDLVPMFAATGLAGELIRRGAITVYESENGFFKDRHEWDLKRSLGVEVQELSAAQVREMEPALGPVVKRGVFTPQWSHITDPKKIVDLLRAWLVANGVELVQENVDRIGPVKDGCEVFVSGGRTINADKAVVAAGAWSGELARQLGDRVLLESERGYNTTIVEPRVSLEREIIFAERKFVATPLSVGLRIGGAAEFGGLNAEPNYARSKALVKLARIYLPGMDGTDGIEWAGHRPATPDSLPVLGRASVSPNIIYAFGHGHLGLTQSATTGKLVGDLLVGRPPAVDLEAYSVNRFAISKKDALNDPAYVFLR